MGVMEIDVVGSHPEVDLEDIPVGAVFQTKAGNYFYMKIEGTDSHTRYVSLDRGILYSRRVGVAFPVTLRPDVGLSALKNKDR